MDGWRRMGSDDHFRIRQVLPARARFFIVNRCIVVNKIHLNTSHPILWLTGGGNGFPSHTILSRIILITSVLFHMFRTQYMYIVVPRYM